MSLEAQLKRLEQRAGGETHDSAPGVLVDFGPWLSVLRVPPKVLDGIEKVYGDKDGEENEHHITTRQD